jgi:hypothetical protein
MDDFIADGRGRKDLVTEVAVVQYGDNNGNIAYCFHITSNVHKTETITFHHFYEKDSYKSWLINRDYEPYSYVTYHLKLKLSLW